MRITSNRMIDLAAAATARNQRAVATASSEVSSGMRVQTPSDDPAAWLAAQRTKLQKVLSEGTGAAVQQSRDRLELGDAALAALGDIVSQVQTLAIQGASDSYDPASRAGLGAQIHGLFHSALDRANARGNDGEYLFAGSLSTTPPFDAAGTYGGDAAVRSVPSDGSVTSGVTIPGTALTAASGVDVLPLLDQVATALSNNDMTTLRAAIPDLKTAVGQISSARTRSGSAMNVLDQTTAARTTLEANMQQMIARFVESDTVTAASELAKATQSLEVSRAVSSHIVAMLGPST